MAPVTTTIDLEISLIKFLEIEPDNVSDHRAAAKIIVFKRRAARGSVCNVLLSRVRAASKCYDGFNPPIIANSPNVIVATTTPAPIKLFLPTPRVNIDRKFTMSFI